MTDKTIKEVQLFSLLSHSILDLHILPTEKCNFRCVYCYESFQIGRMKPHIINGIKNLMIRRMENLKQLRISWFGGEPLAATDVVLDISQFAKDLANRNDCIYKFGMTTNGYLLDKKRFNQVINAGISSFQISLDGSEEFHNKTRLRADGSGTFSKIWQNLLDMAKTDHQFDVVLRLHVTPENLQGIYELLAEIKQAFAHDSRFAVFLKAIANLGGPNSGTFDILTGKSKAEVMAQLNDFLGTEINRHQLEKSDRPYVCYASAQNAWVIRANGSIAKCTVAFDDDRNDIGKLLEDGSLQLNQDKLQLWLRGLKTLDTTTLGCPAYKLPQLENKFKNIPVTTQS